MSPLRSFLRREQIRMNLPGVIHTTAALQLSMGELERKFGYQIHWLCFLSKEDGKLGRWLAPKKDYQRVGGKVFFNPTVFNRIYTISQRERAKFFASVRDLEQHRLADTAKGLKKQYQNFLQRYLGAYSTLLIPGFITYIVVDRVVNQLSRRYDAPIERYCTPLFTTSAQAYQRSLQKIMRKPHRNLTALKIDIARHIEKFYWIYANYYGVNTPTVGQVLQEARSLRAKRAKVKQPRLRPQPRDEKILRRLRMVAYWHDVRKKVNQTANAWFFRFLKQGEGILGIPYRDLCFTTPHEFIALLSGGTVASLASRRRASAILTVLPDKEEVLPASMVMTLWRMTDVEKNQKVIRGVPANPGTVRGRVKVILNVKEEARRFSTGRILVTSMTRPEFYSLMHKASAIITDEGGVTSHAAVISRELGKPCIVGTKVATAVLRDGDLVEVDGSRGIVKKL